MTAFALALGILAAPLLAIAVVAHPRTVASFFLPWESPLWRTALTAAVALAVTGLGMLDGG